MTSEQPNHITVAAFRELNAAADSWQRVDALKGVPGVKAALIMRRDAAGRLSFEDVGLTPKQGAVAGAVLGGVVLGCLIAIGILLGSMAAGDGGAAAMTAVEGEALGNTEAVGWVLYMKYLVPFEVVSVVLLVAMIGAIVFGRRDAALAGAGEEVES